ncbi:MAG: cyclase family protein [Thermoplasmata archaeon]|nr:cyclase family protein [Thermoplasmata archaeon]
MRTIDISMPVHPAMPAFPGDPPVTVEPVQRIDRGDPYNLSRWTFGSHAGTHLDPPLHFLPEGAGADAFDLTTLNGPCTVVDVPAPARSVGPAEVAQIPRGTDRVLFRTTNSARWTHATRFFPDYVAVAPEAGAPLVARGVRLVGIDSLSIEHDPAGRFPLHHELLGAGVVILEGLQLADVAPGPYELRCLPLRVVGGDGGPCRAVLLAP